MGILGSLLGAWFNYWIAVRFGRPFFERFGKYVLVSSETLDKADRFFARHGHISTFVGRLIPGIRQYVSLPAGVARMNLAVFSLFTALGAGIWVVVLALVGYWVGNNQALVMNSLHKITVVTLGLCVVLVAAYVLRQRRNRRLQEE
jgi:membrane protein DedA with SNARE-associated domain